MRVSDADRQRVVEELRRHCAAGRIDVDEYASRVQRALGAATFEELDEVRSDLPMLRIADPVGASGHPVRSATAAGPLSAGFAGAGRGVWAVALAALTVLFVAVALVIGLLAEWTWAFLLLAGYAAGLLQGRIRRQVGARRR
jgi:hypothetical protein